jgi:hypothetical protein
MFLVLMEIVKLKQLSQLVTQIAIHLEGTDNVQNAQVDFILTH